MTEHGDFSNEFNTIIGELQDEQRDPIVTSLLESIAIVENTFAAIGKPTHKQLGEALVLLDNQLEKAGLLDCDVIVSGRIRPEDFEDGEDNNNENSSEDGGDPVISTYGSDQLGPLMHDEKGPYYCVSRYALVCGDLDINSLQIDPTSTDVTEKKVIVYLNPRTNKSLELSHFFAYPEELDLFIPEEPSDFKINQEITTRYKEIARQLGTLPDDCGDDEVIIAALRDMRLEVNWHNYPRHLKKEREELIDHIERYITNRVMFDNTPYVLTVRGAVTGTNARKQPFVWPFAEDTPISCEIGRVKLLQELREGDGEQTDSDISHYRLMLEVFASSSERGSGVNKLHIPLDSIRSFGNIRNSPLFNQPMFEQDNPFDELPLVPTETERAVLGNEEEEEEEDNAAEFTVEVNVGETLSAREKELGALDQRIGELFTQVGVKTNKRYDSYEEAQQGHQEIIDIIEAFDALYPQDRPLILEAEGPGVLSTNVKLDRANSKMTPDDDDDDDAITLRFTGLSLKESDILTIKHGAYALSSYLGIVQAEEAEDQYAIEATLLLTSTDRAPSINFGAEGQSSLFRLLPSSQFFVRINSDAVKLSIPEYERIRKCREAITTVSNKLPDLTYLPWQLTELQERIDSSDPVEFKDFDDLDLIYAIGDSVSGDDESAECVIDALMQILGDHPIEITGEAYDIEGVHVESQRIQGVVDNVISTHTAIPIKEPMLVMITMGRTWYVPLTKIARLRY